MTDSLTSFRDRLTVQPAQIRWEGDVPYSVKYEDIYFSRFGGRNESEHVFLGLNRIPERLWTQASVTVGELGFGTGLNFFLTWLAWKRHQLEGGRLHYVAFEESPVATADLLRLYANEHDLLPLLTTYLQRQPSHLSGVHHVTFEDGAVGLTLFYGPFDQLSPEFVGGVDAWYLDGFAPARNSEMWTEDVFRFISKHSRRGASASTYTVAGYVRRKLSSLGWRIEIVPGVGRKREVLRADYQPTEETQLFTLGGWATQDVPEPWLQVPQLTSVPEIVPKRIMVIGGGIAGATVARAFASRGVSVTLFERGSDVFRGASSVPYAVVLPYLSADVDRRHELFLRMFAFAVRQYRAYATKLPGLWDETGVLYSPSQERVDQLRAASSVLPSELAEIVAPLEMKNRFGVTSSRDAIFFPTAGVVDPQLFGSCVLEHPRIAIRLKSDVRSLRFDEGEWSTISTDGSVLGKGDVVVLCSGAHVLEFSEADGVAIQPVWGEAYLVPPGEPVSEGETSLITDPQRPRPILCTDIYATPSLPRGRMLGSTHVRSSNTATEVSFERPTDGAVLAARSRFELQYKRMLEDFHFDGRSERLPSDEIAKIEHTMSGVRASTYDRLPYVGPLPRRGEFLEAYRDLAKGYPPSQYPPVPYYPRCYTSVGHGSRGFVTAPLVAEILASMILNEPLPIEQRLLNHLLPSRYLVRCLRRGELKSRMSERL